MGLTLDVNPPDDGLMLTQSRRRSACLARALSDAAIAGDVKPRFGPPDPGDGAGDRAVRADPSAADKAIVRASIQSCKRRVWIAAPWVRTWGRELTQ